MLPSMFATYDAQAEFDGDTPFVPNVRFSRRIEREYAFLLKSVTLMIVAACAAAAAAHHRDAMSTEFLQHARTTLLESTLDRFTWKRQAGMVLSLSADSAPVSRSSTAIDGNVLKSITSVPAPADSTTPDAALNLQGRGAATTEPAGPTATQSNPPRHDMKLTMDMSDGGTAPYGVDHARAVNQHAAVRTAPSTARDADHIAASAATVASIAKPATAAQAGPIAAPQIAAASSAPMKASHPPSGFEMVSRAKANVMSIDPDGVTMSSGHKISVGSTFSSGEKLLSTDPANDQFTTDKRTIVVF